MSIRFKLIAAALGLVVASSAIGDVSAKTIAKTTAAHKATKIVAGTHHRLHLGSRVVKHIKIVHRAPTLVKVVKAPAHKVVVARTLGAKKIVRITKAPLLKIVKTHGHKVVAVKTFGKKIVHVVRAPLVRHAMNRGVKASVIR